MDAMTEDIRYPLALHDGEMRAIWLAHAAPQMTVYVVSRTYSHLFAPRVRWNTAISLARRGLFEPGIIHKIEGTRAKAHAFKLTNRALEAIDTGSIPPLPDGETAATVDDDEC